MSLKRSCGLSLAVYVVAAVFVGHLVYRRYPRVFEAVVSGAVGGGIVWMGLAYLAGVRTKLAEISRLRSTDAGGPPPDGKTITVVGSVESDATPLTAPLSGVQCVAYKYEIRKGEDQLFDGFALAPCSILTPHGRMRLLAQPELQLTPREVLPNDAVPHFHDYMKRTKFHEPSLSDIGTMFAELGSETDHIRRDNQMSHDEKIEYADFKEWTLVPGQRVIATGHYSAQRGGLVPEPGMPLSLIVRDAAAGGMVARSVRGAIGNLVGAVIFFAIAAAALLGFYAFVPLGAAEWMAPDRRTMWREVRFERFIEQHVRGRLRAAGWIDSGTTMADVPAGSARGRVTTDARDVVVSRATATRLGDLYTIHIDDDVLVLTIDEYGHPIRLRFGDRDVDPRRDVEFDPRSHVSGRITYLRDDAETPACRVTFNAAMQ